MQIPGPFLRRMLWYPSEVILVFLLWFLAVQDSKSRPHWHSSRWNNFDESEQFLANLVSEPVMQCWYPDSFSKENIYLQYIVEYIVEGLVGSLLFSISGE